MSGHTPDPEFPAWRALLRVHRGGLAKMGSGYADGGRRIPDYIADALDDLARVGQVVFGKPDPTGLARASLTQTGQTRLASLNERLEVPSNHRTTTAAPTQWWALSQVDYHSHVIDDGVVVTRCGHYLPSTVATSPTPGEPVCLQCRAIVMGELVPPPEFGST